MWHATRQNVGWVHISSSRSGEGRKLTDDLMIYNVCGVPFFYYLSHPEVSPKLYYIIDLSFIEMPDSWSNVFLILFFGYSFFYLVLQIYGFLKNKWRVNFAKHVIILSSFLCFSIPYIVFPKEEFLIIPLIFVHTVSYSIFTYCFSKGKIRHSPHIISEKWKLLLKNPFLYLIFFLVLGWGFNILARQDNWWGHNIMIPLIYAIGVIHTIADGYIWKRQFSPELGKNESLS